MYEILSRVNHPHDLRSLSLDELKQLATELRHRIMEVVNQNGGHLASNLGSVELTLALHRVFDFPRDRLVWDVSHQTYPHKLITGRRDQFHMLRTYKGISGFCNKRESIFDLFDAGHAGTAVSLALGVACADHLSGRRTKAVAVVGDAAVAAGMALEGLNHAGYLRRNLLVVLNDNRMSIDVSVGALSSYFNKIRSKPLYAGIKKEIHEIISKIPLVGKRMDEGFEHVLEAFKHSFVPGLLFQELGFDYFGPVDGHSLETLIPFLTDLKDHDGPVLLHCLTVKGHGYEPASQNPIKYHALKGFLTPPKTRGDAGEDAGASEPPVVSRLEGGSRREGDAAASIDAKDHSVALEPGAVKKQAKAYTDVFRDIMLTFARKDRRIVGVTAAMPGGTGLGEFAKEFPDRYFDVGIAEQHAAGLASGLACGGLRPVFAVYSTFCQRAYDQVVHDVCIQENSVILALDRAGLVGEDGWTHHGVFDIAYLRAVPNMLIMAPRDAEEFVRMFQLALDQSTLAVAIRYPKSNVPDLPPSADPVLRIGKAEVLCEGEAVALHAYGSMVVEAFRAAEILQRQGIRVTVVNARFAKPLDVDLLERLSRTHHTLVTIEEHALAGGFGSAVSEALFDRDISFSRVLRLGIPDTFQTFGAREQLLADCGLDAASIAKRVTELVAPRQRAPERVFATGSKAKEG